MRIKIIFISLFIVFGVFQLISQDDNCEISFEVTEQICGDDGNVDLSFKMTIDYPNQMPCAISKIVVAHGAVIGQPPLENPSTISIEDFSSDNTYTITGAISGSTNCYDIKLIDEEGNVCCYSITCIEVDDLDCCDLDVELYTSCAPDGYVTVTVLGGIAPFTVYGANLSDSDIPNEFEETDLDAGTYDLTIIDSNGCVLETTYTILDESSEECCDLDVSISTSCAPYGSVTVIIEGGSAPFTVYGANLANSDIPNEFEDSDLDAGTYDLTIIDSNGCTFETTYTIQENEVTVDASYKGCSPDGYVAVHVNGGSGNYHVIGAALADSDDPTYYEEEGLDPGTYLLTVLDKDTGCLLKTYYTVPEPLIIADIDWDFEECQVIVTLAGGTPDYYISSDSDGPTSNPFVIDLGGDSNVPSLPATISFKDQNGCEVSVTLNPKKVPREIIECMGKGKFTTATNTTSKRSKIDHEESLTHTIELFPSPATDVLNVSIIDDLNNFSALRIIDNTGKTLMTKNFSDQKQLNLDTSSIPPGVYFLQLSSEDGNPIVKRFVKN